LAFLACLDLAEVPDVLPWLPRPGTLLFFYDIENQPWGFDPKDRGSWRVLFSVTPAIECNRASPPAELEALSLPQRYIRFASKRLPPAWTPERYGEISDEDFEVLEDYCESLFGEGPKHQMGGFPQPVQGDDMELECQLASHGLYCGDPSGYEDPKAAALEAGAADWRLLLQLDTDDDLEVMWGDAGTLYFWVREQDAKRGDFANAWLVLQCY
jgi:uncharacterized protein YwqG